MSRKRGNIKRDRINISEKIQSHPTELQSPLQKKPKFSLEYLQERYCISKCEKTDKAAFADKLRELSQLTWAQIKSSGRHQHGYEKIRKASIRVSIPTHITDDVDLIAFRFSRNKPMVGYRDREVFYILWFDRDFSLYDHS